MEIFDSTRLEEVYVNKINGLIDEKGADISKICVNKLIRDDIFPLLDEYCTVIYYPTMDTENNGFHANYHFNGKAIHFVYINTAQHREKQIFTAAHELGHIWNIRDVFSGEIDDELEERIVNRFASELLMPELDFKKFVNKQLLEHMNEDKSVSLSEAIRVITATMNYFFTSFKSVVYRFYEIGMLDEHSCRVLWGETAEHSRESLINASEKIAKEMGYSRLYQTDDRKYIGGLKEMLDEAKNRDEFTGEWLNAFYEKFDFETKQNDDSFDDTFSLLNYEEGAENDN